MRPRVRFLEDSLIEKIVAEARDLLCSVGLTVENAAATDLLLEQGARRTEGRVLLNDEMIDRALATAPASFALYDSAGNQTHDLGGDRVHFTPGSAAIYFLDGQTGEMRRPTRNDYTRYAKLVGRLQHLPAQSTAFIPADVPEIISDSVRLYLGLRHCAKPVVTGSFSIEGFAVMHRLLLAVRGSAEALREKPLAIFTCAPTRTKRSSSANIHSFFSFWEIIWAMGSDFSRIMKPMAITPSRLAMGTCSSQTASTHVSTMATPNTTMVRLGGRQSYLLNRRYKK